MRVTYVGSLMAGKDHPAFLGYDLSQFSASCYLVEVRDGVGVAGPIIEGDVLVVDEARPVQHADLVVVETGEGLGLFRSHRIGGSFRLLPAGGGQGRQAQAAACRGVVVRQARVWAA